MVAHADTEGNADRSSKPRRQRRLLQAVVRFREVGIILFILLLVWRW